VYLLKDQKLAVLIKTKPIQEASATSDPVLSVSIIYAFCGFHLVSRLL
jgi:hypothetical protein